ncbi:MAG TPA: cytochrome c biogenesis protein CcdA [Thermodesulfobacteriota bacterium]|nr:cytochrome c biogenesis protein CcdA [Thermodesulfobacteriota bacterium]
MSGGTPEVGVLIALGAGVASFLSPCVLPLLPSYLALITGLPLQQLEAAGSEAGVRARVLASALGFVAGFSLVFVALGASASLVGQLFFEHRSLLQKVGGALVVLFGLVIAGVIRIPALLREWRVKPLAARGGGFVSAALVGMAFSFGWTPCVGPILGSILVLAGTGEGIGQGTLLMGAYALGLAVPFLASALAVERFLRAFARFRRWLRWVDVVAGLLLVAVGLLLMTGYLTLLNAYLIRVTPQWLWKLL